MEDTTAAWCGDLTATDRRNLRRAQTWTAAWAVIWVAATFLLHRRPDLVPGTAGRVLLIASTTALGVAMVASYVRFLRDADELVRKIQLESLALGFGATIVLTTSWRLIEHAGGPHASIDDAVLPMLLVWVLGQLLAARRYR